jgi:hypothetical protein
LPSRLGLHDTNLHDSTTLWEEATPAHFSRLSSSPSKFNFKSTFLSSHSAMAAILRSLFSSGQSTTPAHGKAKSHSRTESTPSSSEA